MKQMHEWFPLTENNGIWTLTMNAPGNNLMTANFLDAYEITANEILTNAVNEKIKGLIICGGGRHFSVGADVSALTERSAKELSNMQTGNITIPETHLYQKKMVTSWKNMPFPVISAIGGFCIGSGSEIAVSCHYRICEKNARIGQPESTFGILPALGGIARTIEICGVQNAVNMVYSGELLSAQEAFEIHWADILTDKKKSVSEAAALIDWIYEKDKSFDAAKKEDYLASFLKIRNN